MSSNHTIWKSQKAKRRYERNERLAAANHRKKVRRTANDITSKVQKLYDEKVIIEAVDSDVLKMMVAVKTGYIKPNHHLGDKGRQQLASKLDSQTGHAKYKPGERQEVFNDAWDLALREDLRIHEGEGMVAIYPHLPESPTLVATPTHQPLLVDESAFINHTINEPELMNRIPLTDAQVHDLRKWGEWNASW